MTTARSRQREWWRTLAPATILFLVVMAVTAIPVVRDFQMRIADTYFRTAPPPLQTSPVVIVLIDDESLREYGRWPWSRARVAELVRNLDRAGTRVIGLDILFSEPQSAAIDRELADALRENRRTVIVDKIGMYPDGPHWIEPLPVLADAALGVGHAQAVLDGDGLCRRFPLRELTIDGPRLAFALEVARHVDAPRTAQFLAAYGISGPDTHPAVTAAAPVLAPIYFRRDAFHSISAAAVLQGRDLGDLRGRPGSGWLWSHRDRGPAKHSVDRTVACFRGRNSRANLGQRIERPHLAPVAAVGNPGPSFCDLRWCCAFLPQPTKVGT